MSCGIGTGFIVIPQQGATLLKAIQFIASVDMAANDPLTITIEGSNATFPIFMLGKSWSSIYNDSTGLDADPGRGADGLIQCIPNNAIWYTSYRVLVTSKRGASNSVQYSGVRLLGQENPNKGKISSLSDLNPDMRCANWN